MVKTRQKQVSIERYDIIMGRYEKFLDAALDVTKEPVRVFDPLCQRSLDELELIRDLSKTLQLQKEEDVLKAKKAAEEEMASLQAKEKEKEVQSEEEKKEE